VRKEFVLLAVLALMLLLTGCEAADRQLIIDLALSWAAENAVDIGRYTLFGRSGDAEVDAVMGARDVINNVTAADQLMEEGREENDLDKMEQAIEKRPGDYTYRVSYGTALLQAGDTAAAETQFTAANYAVEDYGGEHAQSYAVQGIDELGALRPGFEENGFADGQQCRAYYRQLAHFYRVRHAGTGQAYFREQAERYEALAGGCQ
jgi:Flp pilus assembly protein TadD